MMWWKVVNNKNQWIFLLEFFFRRLLRLRYRCVSTPTRQGNWKRKKSPLLLCKYFHFGKLCRFGDRWCFSFVHLSRFHALFFFFSFFIGAYLIKCHIVYHSFIFINWQSKKKKSCKMASNTWLLSKMETIARVSVRRERATVFRLFFFSSFHWNGNGKVCTCIDLLLFD